MQAGERDFVLQEMRDLLASVNGIAEGLSKDDYGSAAQWARKVGIKGHGTIESQNPAIMAKLPMGFKQMGLSLHKDFDEIGELLEKKAPSKDVLSKVSVATSKCVACHSQFRLEAQQ